MVTMTSFILRFLTIWILSLNLLVAGWSINFLRCSQGPCTEGTYFDTQVGQCLQCTLGTTYMDETEHACVQCKLCSKPESFNEEILLQECTLTSNAIIGCKKGFYYESVSRTCTECTECGNDEEEKTKCGQYKDTVCHIVTRAEGIHVPEVKISQETTTTTTMGDGKNERKNKLRLNAAERRSNSGEENDNNTETIVGIVIGSILVVPITVLICICIHRVKKRSRSYENGEQTVAMKPDAETE